MSGRAPARPAPAERAKGGGLPGWGRQAARPLLTNEVIFHNALDIAEIVRQLQEEGRVIDPEGLAHISPYLTEQVRRFGEYPTHELGLEPGPYDPHLDVDFSPRRGDPPGVDGYGQAA
ncbi:Tn3 family transposase [Streptomyces sp. NPDC002668]|uniref:Tn3 family transposase n=1 Tax=Streptomyces sp. NPDC002668 TaxID=3154422 RepID=UPI0033299E16